jgi:porin
MGYLIISALFLTLSLFSADHAFSGNCAKRHDEMQDHLKHKEEPSSFWERQYFTGDWGGKRARLAENGVTIGSSYVADILGNPVGGKGRGIAFAGSFGVDLNVDFEKFSNLKGLELYTSAIARTGTNLSDKKIGNAFNVAQVYGGQNVRFNELYLKLSLFEEKVILKGGRLDGGNDFLQSELYYKYVNNGFDGNPVSIFLNSPAFVAYPNATWGIFLACYPTPCILMKFAAYVAEPEVTENHYHGFNWTFKGKEGILLMTEWSYQVNQQSSDTGYPGNYRGGFYYVTDQTGQKFQGGSFHGDLGYYVLLDQMIYRHKDSDRGLTSFVTLLFAPKDRNTFPFYTTSGLVYKGLFSSRPDDDTNIGWIYGKYSSELRAAQELAKKTGLLGPFGNESQDFEMIFEINHWFQVNKWWQIVPDIQYIIHPKGLSSTPNALVVGAQIGVIF